MNTLILERLPTDVHQRKALAPNAYTVLGSSVFASDFVKALLRYGSYDSYYVLELQPIRDSEKSEVRAQWGNRIQFVGLRNLEDIRHLVRPVIASTRPNAFLHHRLVRGVFSPRLDWPITGFIHSVNSTSPPDWILSLVLGDVRPWDALICSSTAGKLAVERYIDALPDVYPQLLSAQPFTRPQLPVIPLGTDELEEGTGRRAVVRQRCGISDQHVLILYLGRISPSSKCDLTPLIAAFAGMAPEQRRRARLLIAGDDTWHHMAEALLTLAQNLGCGDSIMVHANPTPSEKLDLYHAADLFVSPSDNVQETFGLTIIEALAAGLPVIASDWNGYRDLIVQGETGFLVPTYWTDLGEAFDHLSTWGSYASYAFLSGATVIDVDRLKAYMELLTNDDQRRRVMGINARRSFLAEFHWSAVVPRYEALWSELRERAERDDGSRFPASYNVNAALRTTFDHYPSSNLPDEWPIALGSMAHLFSSTPAFSHATQIRSVASYDAIARAILEHLDAAQESSIAAIVRHVSSSGQASDLTARLVVARLLKHGVLRPLPSRTLEIVRSPRT